MREINQNKTDKSKRVKQVSKENRTVFQGALNPIFEFSTLEVNYKQDRRSSRLFDLYVLSQAYHKYQLFCLCKCSINHNTDYILGENTSMLMNAILKLETTPSDFIKSQDEANNELIEKYQDYESFLDNNHLDKHVVDAFCKASEHSSGTILKINSVAFIFQIEALLEYNLELITKKQLQQRMVDYCILSKKTKKLNTVLFKKTIHFIEKLYTEIQNKRTLRKINKA